MLGDGAILAVGVERSRRRRDHLRSGHAQALASTRCSLPPITPSSSASTTSNTPYDESRSGVTIGTNVWVGAHCVVLPGVTIGDNALVAAGSVVNRDVPANQIWAGVPARFVRKIT